MKIKTSSMITFGHICLTFNLIFALFFGLEHDKSRSIMFMVGAMLWIFGILHWGSIKNMEDKQAGIKNDENENE